MQNIFRYRRTIENDKHTLDFLRIRKENINTCYATAILERLNPIFYSV